MSEQGPASAHSPGGSELAVRREARPPYADGAAAARAATRATRLEHELTPMPPTTTPGPSIDAAAARGPRTPALWRELSRWEPSTARRFRNEVLEPVGAAAKRLLDPATYRRMIRDLRMSGRSEVVDEFGLDPVFAERLRPIFEFLYRTYWRVETSGMEHVPDRGRAIIVANHSGTLPYDAAMLMYGLRFDHPAHRTARPLVEDFVFHFPYVGVAMNRIGGVRASPENARRLLDQQQLVVVFPEGTKGIGKLYKERYKLQRFGRGGFIKLALRTRTPVIPTAIVGAEEIHPMLGRIGALARAVGLPYLPVTPTFPLLGPLGALPLPSKWFILFGKPVDLGDHGPDAADDGILVGRLTERVRAVIQDMIDSALEQRGSSLLG
ncbi:MAG: acyltransferase family protein [Myxococcales bacterium]|nr:acyltransferase family protein [Myxococcales bacterium]